MELLSKFTFILILIIIYNLFPFSQKKTGKTILSNKSAIIFEFLELSIIIFLIVICIYKKYFINGFMLIIAFIEHIKQITYCYRQLGRDIHSYITIIIYIILLIYNILIDNLLFIIVWFIAICIHIISIYFNLIYHLQILFVFQN